MQRQVGRRVVAVLLDGLSVCGTCCGKKEAKRTQGTQ